MRRDLATERRQAELRQRQRRHGDGHVVALRALPDHDAQFWRRLHPDQHPEQRGSEQLRSAHLDHNDQQVKRCGPPSEGGLLLVELRPDDDTSAVSWSPS